MKTIPVALQAHYEGGDTTLAHALKITRADDEVYGFTDREQDDAVNGVTYSASQGLDITNLLTTAGAAVGNMELTTLNDGTLFTMADLLGGRWRNAAFEIFRYNWEDPADGVDVLLTGTLGEFKIGRGFIVIELRDLRQYLQQPVGDVTSKSCRARLGDARCAKDLAAFTVTGTLTGVTSNQVFADSGRAEAADYFGEGTLTWLSGNNTGLSAKIKTFSAGSFTLALPAFAAVQVGDTYRAIAGCRRRLEEDCLDKFDNVLNFVGEPHRRGVNNITSPA